MLKTTLEVIDNIWKFLQVVGSRKYIKGMQGLQEAIKSMGKKGMTWNIN